MCVSKRELIYLVISSGLLEGKMHGISSTRRKRNLIVNLNATRGKREDKKNSRDSFKRV